MRSEERGDCERHSSEAGGRAPGPHGRRDDGLQAGAGGHGRGPGAGRRPAAQAGGGQGREASEGLIEAYVHHNGRVGVLVEVNCETDFVANTPEFRQLAKDLTHQIAATAPIALRREDVPAEVVAREREIYRAQVERERKPDHVRDKIVEGRLTAFYEERVLLEQKFVKDGSRTVGDMVKELAAKTGENVFVRRFVRFERGGN